MKGLANKKTDDTVIASFAFTLDNNGNRTNITEDVPLSPLPSALNIAYTYNLEKNRIESAGSTAFDHDLEGQLTLKGSKTFTFDAAHRLETITGSTPSDFTYDGANRRLSATRNGVTTRYIYDPFGNLIATANDANTIQAYFIFGQGLLATINPSDQTFCYHFDSTGNTIAMTDNSQDSINHYSYTPFGVIIAEQETISQPFKYVGQFGVIAEPDGLYYMRARYYDADTGRFISEDPIGFAGGDVNLYGYCLNNPMMFIDPSGLAWYDNWHYEGRDDRNSNLPVSPDKAAAAGGTLLPVKMSQYHDNGVGKPEQKYIFSDGREAVYDGDSGQLVTDSQFKGTYNYVNPAEPSWNPLKWPEIAGRGVGHFVTDMIPYYIGGNTRSANGANVTSK